jgi:hypothetical protein
MFGTEKNVLGSDYKTPLDAGQVGGRLEFTCLPPERDTMWTAWVVPLTCGNFAMMLHQCFGSICRIVIWFRIALWLVRNGLLSPYSTLGHVKCTDMKGVSTGDTHVSSSEILIELIRFHRWVYGMHC